MSGPVRVPPVLPPDAALAAACEGLFDGVADTVFFIKDGGGRYTSVNTTLVARTGRARKHDLLGQTAEDVFPGPLGRRIAAQDLAVLREARPVAGILELHLYPDGGEGWCLTWKQPLAGGNGQASGLVGISRDLGPGASDSAELPALARVLAHIRDNIDQPLRLEQLAAMASLSRYQLDQRLRALFGVTAGQYVVRARIDHACTLLRAGEEAISGVALACGYGDQAAFTRQFGKSVGLTPSDYQKRHRPA